jgi:hypothetical protein
MSSRVPGRAAVRAGLLVAELHVAGLLVAELHVAWVAGRGAALGGAWLHGRKRALSIRSTIRMNTRFRLLGS